MELFIKVDTDKWAEVRQMFKENLPEGALGFCLFDMMISYPGAISSQVFCPFGDIHNGVICLSDEFDDYKVNIIPLKDMQKMEEALATTRLIDWSRSIMVPSASPVVVQCLEKLQAQLSVKVHYDAKSAAVKYYLESKTEGLFEDLTPPANTYVGPLTSEHLPLVDETWTYHGNNTHLFFKKLMEHDLTWVLYSCEDQPLAWITVSLSGSLTHLFCLEPHRRKGYAEFITKVAVSDWLGKGKNALAYTIEDNTKPQHLFRKLGFEVVGTDYWLFINKA